MAKPVRGLGKGLGALLGDEAQDMAFRRPVQYINNNAGDKKDSGSAIRLISIASIVPNPFQPRVTFDPQALEELSVSIKTLGLIQPITVRKMDDGQYQIISGERRFRASKLAGLSEVPAYIRETDDSGMLEMAIVENVQRADLDPIETAMSYQRLIDECNLTQEQMADRIGKSRVAVTNYLRLLRLPAKVQYDVKVGNISVGHAKVLLGLDDKSVQEQLSDTIIRDGLSVRALEALLKTGLPTGEKGGKTPSKQESSEIPDEYYSLVEIVGKYFKNNVSVKRTAEGKGSITIRFESDSQVQEFLSSLREKQL